MTKRNMSVALCGGIVGLIVGAGALLTSQEGVSASIKGLSYSTIMNTEVLERSEILRRPRNTSFTSSSSSAAASSQSSAPAVMVEKVSAECAVARAVAVSFTKAVDRFVPEASRNIEMKVNLKTVAQEAIAQYCPDAQHAAASSVRSVDNDCEQYGKTTDRYFTCVVEEAAGHVYP